LSSCPVAPDGQTPQHANHNPLQMMKLIGLNLMVGGWLLSLGGIKPTLNGWMKLN
jgi:hypothetical protein